METLNQAKTKIIKADKVLIVALIVGFLFCLHGLAWKYQHPDQMAFRPLFLEGKLPFNPGWFHKPPFHTYFNYFLSDAPISFIGKIINLQANYIQDIKFIWSRILTYFLFLGSILLVFQITRKSFGIFSARIVTIIFATSAGFIAHSNFLTADIPVMFWMLVALYFSHDILFNQKLSNYLWAGFFTGIATATKYNGLAIGITIVVAHILACSSSSWKSIPWKQMLFSQKLFLGLFMVIVGFVAGNPFSVLDYRNFKSDFIYNYTVTPVYEGQTGHSYGYFFSRVIEIIGLPSFLICLIAFLLALYLTLENREQPIQTATILLLFSPVLLYYYKFAEFPRLETRFVLPIVPLWLLLSAPLWDKIKFNKIAVSVILIGLISYNTICSFYVGKRFLEDPRTVAKVWVKQNIPDKSSIESDSYSPSWNKIKGGKLQETFSPFVDGRERLFAKLFPGNAFIAGTQEDSKKTDELVDWYSLKKLLKRNPDFLTIDSLYYKRFIEPGIRRELYPSMNKYFQDLLQGKYPYKIAFDRESKLPSIWVYPQEIDFLHNRITILARKEKSNE